MNTYFIDHFPSREKIAAQRSMIQSETRKELKELCMSGRLNLDLDTVDLRSHISFYTVQHKETLISLLLSGLFNFEEAMQKIDGCYVRTDQLETLVKLAELKKDGAITIDLKDKCVDFNKYDWFHGKLLEEVFIIAIKSKQYNFPQAMEIAKKYYDGQQDSIEEVRRLAELEKSAMSP